MQSISEEQFMMATARITDLSLRYQDLDNFATVCTQGHYGTVFQEAMEVQGGNKED